MNYSPDSQLSVQQRVDELLIAAMAMYSDRLSDPESVEYMEILDLCRERAAKAFRWHRSRSESDEAVFAGMATREIPGTRYTTTNPLQDLVHCELVMRGHSPAVDVFLERFRGVAEKMRQKIDPTHRPPRARKTGERSELPEKMYEPDTAAEIAIQALLHDYREEFRKGTKKRSEGIHAGELDGLPLRGLPLRSFEAQTPLFNWMCRSLPRLLRKLQVLRSISSTEELGTGTIAAGATKLLLHTGYFHQTRHIRAFVRISGAGADGKPLGTRLLDVTSSARAVTHKPAQTTVSVPRSVRLVHRQPRERQPADSFDREDSSDGSAPGITDRCAAVLVKLMYQALNQSGLKASEIELLKDSLFKKQGELARERRRHTGHIGRKLETIKDKLAAQFQAISESSVDEETHACLEIICQRGYCQTFAELLVKVLEYWPTAPLAPPTQPSLHSTWAVVLRNVPEESQPSQSGTGMEQFINEILRNAADEQGSDVEED